MDLSTVPEIGEAFAQKLREAGVPSVEALAVWEELAPLAERAGLEVEQLESFRDSARGALEHALAAAGVDGPEALAVADVAALAGQTGLDPAHLERYQRRAQDAAGRVVLVDGAPVARVTVKGETHHAVALVTAAPSDSDDDVFGRATGDAVLLRPRAEVVPVRIAGVAHRGLALYKERRKDGGDVEEVRVRIADIRDVPAAEPKPEKASRGIGRLFSRKK